MNGEPKDICCICSATGEMGTFTDVHEADFELLCPNCKNCRCSNCNFLRSSKEVTFVKHFCRHRGEFMDPVNKVCDHWTPQDESYSPRSTYADYS